MERGSGKKNDNPKEKGPNQTIEGALNQFGLNLENEEGIKKFKDHTLPQLKNIKSKDGRKIFIEY
jgi:hypothetical protein